MTGHPLLDLFTVFVIAFFTLTVFSFLYRDNPVYKFAEHLFVGVAAGYYVITQFRNIFIANLFKPLFIDAAQGGFAAPAGHHDKWTFMLLIPLFFGILMFFKFSTKLSWVARWPMAVVIGAFSGLAVIGSAQGDLVPQIQANMIPFVKRGTYEALVNSFRAFTNDPDTVLFPFLEWIGNPLLIVGVFSSLIYFFFSKEHKGAIGGAATLGIWFLMASFGASYGNTVMTRISLLLERFDTLVESKPVSLAPGWEWLHHWHVSVATLLLLVAVLVVYFRRHPEERATPGG